MKKRAVRRTIMVRAMEESKGGELGWGSFLEEGGGEEALVFVVVDLWW